MRFQRDFSKQLVFMMSIGFISEIGVPLKKKKEETGASTLSCVHLAQVQLMEP